jgi:hypothetical protein
VEEDEAALLKALKDGSFSKTNKKSIRHRDQGFETLQALEGALHCFFAQIRILPEDTIRYRLNILLQNTIRYCLNILLHEFKNATDERGKSVFEPQK